VFTCKINGHLLKALGRSPVRDAVYAELLRFVSDCSKFYMCGEFVGIVDRRTD